VGLKLGALQGGWLGMAGADLVGGALCLALLFWRLGAYMRDAPAMVPKAAAAGAPSR
jgi:hypothetical protein